MYLDKEMWIHVVGVVLCLINVMKRQVHQELERISKVRGFNKVALLGPTFSFKFAEFLKLGFCIARADDPKVEKDLWGKKGRTRQIMKKHFENMKKMIEMTTPGE